MTNKWHRLLNQLENFRLHQQEKLWTQKNIEEFEKKNKFILPEEYKIFIQVFGFGYLGPSIIIRRPNDEFFNHYLQPKLKPHYNLAYFGYIWDNHLLFWKLSTYSVLDLSYDIYITEITRNDYYDKIPYKIGRDFYHFVRDFCLGNKSFKLLPKSEYLDPQIFVHTFEPIQDEDFQYYDAQYLAFIQSWYHRQNQLLNQRKHINNYFNLPHEINSDSKNYLDKFSQKIEAVENNKFYSFFRYLKSFRTHLGAIYSVKFTPDGQILVTASGDTTIKLWNLTTNEETLTLRGHTEAVLTLAISSNNHILASGSADNTIKLWNLKTGEEIQTLIGHSNSVLSLAISPNDQTLASGSADTTIKLWDLSTGTLIHTLTNHTESVVSIAISPDGQTLASGSADYTLKLWFLRTGQEKCTLQETEGVVLALDFHPSKQILVSASEDANLKIWDLLSFEVIQTINTDTTLLSITISPDEKHLACTLQCSVFGGAIIWELESGKVVTYFEERMGYENDYPSIKHCDSIFSVAFSPDGKTIATGSADTTAKLWGIPPSLEYIE